MLSEVEATKGIWHTDFIGSSLVQTEGLHNIVWSYLVKRCCASNSCGNLLLSCGISLKEILRDVDSHIFCTVDPLHR